jgi:hypothetical protein
MNILPFAPRFGGASIHRCRPNGEDAIGSGQPGSSREGRLSGIRSSTGSTASATAAIM